MNKIKLYFGSIAGIASAVLGIAVTHAQTIPSGAIVVPTSTASSMLASVGNIITDPGVLAIVVVAVSLPLFFWFVHQMIGLLPKSRGRK